MVTLDLKGAALALGVGLVGAGLFWLIGFPSAPLTGAATAVSIAGLSGLRVALPNWLRDTAFILLGIGIGSSVTPEMLASAARWPATIAILAAALLVGMAISQRGLTRWMGFQRRDAVLAAAPGHLSYVLSLSLEGKGATPRIAIVQSIRVLFLTLVVPIFVTVAFGASGVSFAPAAHMSIASAILLVAGTFTLGLVFKRIHMPAAFLLAGMGFSAAGHALGLTPGQMPATVTFAAFLVMGVLIGSRFSGQGWDDLRASLWAGLWVTGVTVATTLLAVVVSMLALGLSPALLIVAFAPGGVEAMAAISVALGFDPAFVAAHHVMRLLILTFLIPMLLSWPRSSATV
ncbi:AbrB family transcriptional regulator [Ponticoccus alexandrii]|uniref:AbrB family transcriptional regulator n=1 Tax=Ponticoccus alexandrii TaxID=1943633 RepID=A0ABX7F749_9RHOB|nr:AbrB family transcriptional regulator [Ponticoccus alexandrii]QRF65632.1 AbrB family transcriptional regulator [Ponticoccus alexandrii]